MSFKDEDERMFYPIKHFYKRLGVEANQQPIYAYLMRAMLKNRRQFGDDIRSSGKRVTFSDTPAIFTALENALKKSGLNITPTCSEDYISWSVFSSTHLSDYTPGEQNNAKKLILAERGHKLSKTSSMSFGRKGERLSICIATIPEIIEFIRRCGYEKAGDYDEKIEQKAATRYEHHLAEEKKALEKIRTAGCDNLGADLSASFKISLEERLKLLTEMEEKEESNPCMLVSREEAVRVYRIPPVALQLYDKILGEPCARDKCQGWEISKVILVQKELIERKKEKEALKNARTDLVSWLNNRWEYMLAH